MKQILFRIIYQEQFNKLLRLISKPFQSILPRRMWIPPSGKITIEVDKSCSFKVHTNQTCIVTYRIYWEGYLKFEFTPIFMQLVKNQNTFMDIGSNIGYYSLLAACIKPDMNIVSFEPAIGPRNYLQRNVKENNFKNIKIEEFALSDKTGEITFYEVANNKYKSLDFNLDGEGNTGSKTTGKDYFKNTVKTLTVDDYLKCGEFNQVDLVKIDTEGTEFLILSNAHTLLSKHRPIVICETLFNMIEKDLEDLMVSHEYLMFNEYNDKLKEVATIKREVDNGVRNCFFVPKEKRHLVEPYLK